MNIKYKKPRKFIIGQAPAFPDDYNLSLITELAQTFKFFDGACFCVNYGVNDDWDKKSEVVEVLEANKGCGRITRSSWVNTNGVGMEIALKSGPRNGDWVFLLDSQEIFLPEFLAGLDSFIENMEKEGYVGCSWGRIYGWKNHSYMSFPNNTHSSIQGVEGKIFDLRNEPMVRYEKEGVYFANVLLNRKNLDNSLINSAAKYLFHDTGWQEIINQYNRFGQQVITYHEGRRIEFIDFLFHNLNIENIDQFRGYLEECVVNSSPVDPDVLEYLEFEQVLKSWFRLNVLKHPREEILKNRHNWSIKYWFSGGEGRCLQMGSPSMFTGEVNKYLKQLGLPEE